MFVVSAGLWIFATCTPAGFWHHTYEMNKSRPGKGKRHSPLRKKEHRITEAELSLFCEEVTEKLRRLEAYIQGLLSENIHLKEDVSDLRRVAWALEQRVDFLGQWQSVGQHTLAHVRTLEANEMPVIILRWDDTEE